METDLKTETEVLYFQNVCHACFSSEAIVEDFTESGIDYVDFLSIYKSFTGLDLNEFDTLSFCQPCILKVQEFYKYRKKCLEVHSTVKKLFAKNQTVVCEETGLHNDNNNTITEEITIECEACTKDYKCLLCEETFTAPYLLAEHLKKESKYKAHSKVFGCGRCQKSYTSLKNLQTHIYSHLNLKPYKCHSCPKEFTRAATLKAHRETHLSIRSHLCPICGKDFSSAMLFKRHQSTHTRLGRFQCELCPTSVATSHDLSVHMRSHTGEKPYLCSTCGKTFRRMSHLNVHRRTHTGEKPYKCRYCDKGFAQSNDWRAHERLHRGEKPYGCTVCFKRFNQSSGLTSHMKTHAMK